LPYVDVPKTKRLICQPNIGFNDEEGNDITLYFETVASMEEWVKTCTQQIEFLREQEMRKAR